MPLPPIETLTPLLAPTRGDLDVLAPVEDARDFVTRLRAASEQPVYFLELRGAQHAFETFASIRANAVVDAAARFLDAVWRAHLHTPSVAPTPDEVRLRLEEELPAAAGLDRDRHSDGPVAGTPASA